MTKKSVRYCEGTVPDAMKRCCEDVRTGAFPEETRCCRMLEGEEENFGALLGGAK